MAEEFTQEAVAEAVEAQEVPEAKPAETPPQPVEKTYSQKEVDALLLKERQTVSKHTQRIKELEGKAHLSEAQTKELSQLRDDIEDMKALMLDQGGSPAAEKTNYQMLQERRARERAQQPQKQMDPLTASQLTRLEELRDDAEVEWGSPEAEEAKRIYSDQGFSAARKYLKGLIEGKDKPKEAPKTETPEEMEKRIEARLMKKFSLDSVDTEQAAGARGARIYTAAELNDRDFVRRNWADIEKAQREGRIKE